MNHQQVAGADYENQYKLLQYEHGKLKEKCQGIEVMLNLLEKHHPATDWHDLADKYYKQDAPNMTAEAIFNFFKTEINGK